jgi:tetratricopeptide (TPR) repeat protein
MPKPAAAMLRFAALVPVSILAGAAPCRAAVTMDGETRLLRVRVAADDELREGAGWEATAAEHLRFASDYLEASFAIRLQVAETVTWESDDRGLGLGDLVDELQEEIPLDDVDVVIGLSAQRPRSGKLSKYVGLPTGLTPSLGRVCMVRVLPEDENYDLRLALIHEIAHLFGAFHVAQQDSIMREVVQGPRTWQIDSENAKMVRLMRLYDFEQGVEGLSEEALRRMTRIWEPAAARGDANPVAEALYNAGVEHHAKGETERAASLWRRATTYDHTYAEPHGSLGTLLAGQGKYAEALKELEIADRLGWPDAKQMIEAVKHEQEQGPP